MWHPWSEAKTMPTERIILNPDLDIPLLVRVRNSRYITSLQLFNFAKRACIAKSPGAYYSRVARLIKSGLMQLVNLQIGKHGTYMITRAGLRLLEDQQCFLTSLTSNARTLGRRQEIPHALVLNDIREKLEGEFGVRQWLTDLELRAANLEVKKFAKNYDAFCVFPRESLGKEPVAITFEYERTLKSAQRYADINDVLEQEESASLLLYLCAAPQMIPPIAAQIHTGAVMVAFATAGTLLKDGRECIVLVSIGGNLRPLTLRTALERIP